MTMLNMASGGVLAGVSFVHVMPDAGHVINNQLNGFPISFYITFFGLLIMVTLTKLGAHSDLHENKPSIMNKDDIKHKSHED